MTPEQSELRAERMAILIHDAGLSEQEARQHCNRYPRIYGIDGTETQGALIATGHNHHTR